MSPLGRNLNFVNENRGLFATLSVTLIGIGLGGYVSLRIADHPNLGSLTDLCFVFLGVGLGIFLILQVLYIRLHWIKWRVSYITAEGEMLFERLNEMESHPDETMESFIADYDRWVGDSTHWLYKHDRHACVHFKNRAGQLAVHGLVGGNDVANYLIALDTRLTRLGEIMAQKM